MGIEKNQNMTVSKMLRMQRNDVIDDAHPDGSWLDVWPNNCLLMCLSKIHLIY